MATTIWKGHLTFGLVSIPVKLYRGARAEKVSFRQLHAGTGARVRQSLVVPAGPPPPPQEEVEEERPRPVIVASKGKAAAPEPLQMPRREPAPPPPIPEPREISRSEIVKGYEYARDQFVTLTKEELAEIAPKTAREMELVEFIKLDEVDPIYYETSYYVAPDKGGERAYALLFRALKESGLAGVAQIAMHNREHVVIIRPGRRGMVLHTMFYENEVHREDEYQTDTGGVNQKELDLALMLISSLQAPFEPEKYRDTYREKLEALIEAKLAGHETVQAPAPEARPVVNILEALQQSLKTVGRKPPATEDRPAKAPNRAQPRKRG